MATDPSNFWQWMSAINPHERMPVVVTMYSVGAAVLVLIAAMVAMTVYKIHRNRLTDALKRELLERGMSAADIVEVVRATPTITGGRSGH